MLKCAELEILCLTCTSRVLPGDATVVIVSETTGEAHNLRSLRGESVLRSNGGTELMCADVAIPDVFSLHVTKPRYTQMNWHGAFQMTYFGRTLIL